MDWTGEVTTVWEHQNGGPEVTIVLREDEDSTLPLPRIGQVYILVLDQERPSRQRSKERQ